MYNFLYDLLEIPATGASSNVVYATVGTWLVLVFAFVMFLLLIGLKILSLGGGRRK